MTTPGGKTASEPIPKSQYIQRADEICEDAHEKRNALEDEANAAIDRGNYDEAADALADGASATRDQLQQLKALGLPDEGAAAIKEIYRKLDASLAILDQVVEALQGEDLSRVTALADEIDSINHETRGIATGYGFKVCGKSD